MAHASRESHISPTPCGALALTGLDVRCACAAGGRVGVSHLLLHDLRSASDELFILQIGSLYRGSGLDKTLRLVDHARQVMSGFRRTLLFDD